MDRLPRCNDRRCGRDVGEAFIVGMVAWWKFWRWMKSKLNESSDMEAELHEARFPKKKSALFCFQEFWKKNVVVDNIVIHRCENFQSNIPYILFWEKKRNLQIWIGEQCAISKKLKSSQISLFYTGQNITSLWLKIFTLMDLSILQHYDFFFKSKFADSKFLKNRAPFRN